MSRSGRVRWTIAVTDDGYDGPYFYGQFESREVAERKAASWQRTLRKRRGNTMNVTVHAIYPDDAATRDNHWPAR